MMLPAIVKQGLSHNKLAVAIIILFHIVGLIGLNIPQTRSLFLHIVPFHLLLMLAVVIFSHDRVDERFVFFILAIFLLGFIAEWFGIHKHWIFGDYFYGETLGFKISGVPLIIGINWFLLIYCTGVFMQRSRLKSIWPRIILGSMLLVLLDILIEPSAVHFDYWHWTNNVVPIKNYFCWFAISVFMLGLFELFRFKIQNIVASVFLLTEFIFFGLLYLIDVIGS